MLEASVVWRTQSDMTLKVLAMLKELETQLSACSLALNYIIIIIIIVIIKLLKLIKFLLLLLLLEISL